MNMNNFYIKRLKNLSSILEENIELAGVSNDPEVIHRTRVSIRRIRGILSLYSLPLEASSLRELATTLNPLRDLEVEIDYIHSSSLSLSVKKKLLDSRLLTREVRRCEIRNHGLSFDKGIFLEGVVPKLKKIPDDKQIFSKLLKVAKKAGSYALSPDLHRLRISLKKIRYILEAVIPVYPEYETYIPPLKRFQDILGSIHDIEVWMKGAVLRPAEKDYSEYLWLEYRKKREEFYSIDIFSLLEDILSTSLAIMKVADDMPLSFLYYPEKKERLDSCRNLGIAVSPDSHHILRVFSKSEVIFNVLRDKFKLTEENLFCLQCAALLHDIGHSVGGNSHHKNSFELILSSKALYLGPVEREIAAIVARNHRKKPEFNSKLLSKKEREKLPLLSAILRCADGMEFESYEYIENFEVSLSQDTLTFVLPLVSHELKERFKNKSAYLKKVSQLDIVIK